MVLRACNAVSGTDLGYDDTWYRCRIYCYACATGYPVLTFNMLLPGQTRWVDPGRGIVLRLWCYEIPGTDMAYVLLAYARATVLTSGYAAPR